MIREVGLDSVHTTSVESGRSIPGSLQNVEGAEGQSTAVRSAKRVHGYSTVTGVLQHPSDCTCCNLEFYKNWPFGQKAKTTNFNVFMTAATHQSFLLSKPQHHQHIPKAFFFSDIIHGFNTIPLQHAKATDNNGLGSGSSTSPLSATTVSFSSDFAYYSNITHALTPKNERRTNYTIGVRIPFVKICFLLF
jgi:hypothetical protein